MDKKKIEKRAESILNAYNFNNASVGCIDVVRFARFFGFSILQRKDLKSSEDGYVTVSNEGDKEITINNTRNLESKRFIIAQELSYYFLFYNDSNNSFTHHRHTKKTSTQESDADYLASCLLMPKKNFKKTYDNLKEKYNEEKIITELQKIYHTPANSIKNRIKELS